MAGDPPRTLPRGRHGLPAALVADHQRARVLDAVLVMMAEHGYEGLRIEDIAKLSAVSRRTFYQHFANREDAAIEALQLVLAQLVEAVETACRAASGAVEAITASVDTVVAMAVDRPDLARVCFVAAPAGPPSLLDVRNRSLATLAGGLQRLAHEISDGHAHATLAGACELLAAQLRGGRDVNAVRDDLVAFVCCVAGARPARRHARTARSSA